MDQQAAIHGVVEFHEFGNVLEDFAGLLLGPEVVSGREFYKISGGGTQRVAGVASSVARPIFRKIGSTRALKNS